VEPVWAVQLKVALDPAKVLPDSRDTIAAVTDSPTPLSEIPWEVYSGPAAFRLLSVRMSEPLSVPLLVGAKLIGRTHELPSTSFPEPDEQLFTTGHAPVKLLLS